MRNWALVIGGVFGVVASGWGAPRFAGVFGDGVVLQREREVVVWGFGAAAGTGLEVRFGEEAAAATVGDGGRWEARLPAMGASGEGRVLELFEDGVPAAVVGDVLVGEVWLAAGQSNMQFAVKGMVAGLPQTRGWVDACERPAVRLMRCGEPVLGDREAEAVDLRGRARWTAMTVEGVQGFSAVATVVARELHDQLKVPVGVIDVSWGGKPIEGFMPREVFEGDLLGQIKALADAGDLEALKSMRGGVIVRNPEGHPGAIFNARMVPLVRFGLRGFLWYQAESNAGRGEDPREYATKQRALVEGWRARWGDDGLPFYYVQLPSYGPATGWVRVREEQRRALDVPGTGMAVTIDVRGEGIHPPDKLTVGKRLAALALVKTYGRSDPGVAGPQYAGHRVDGREVRVRFSGVGDGLMVGDKGVLAPVEEGGVLQWFEVAGEEGVWKAAEARIEGNEVVVSSDKVEAPVAVRYACHVQPQGGNLYNRGGWPASPFCSRLDWLKWED